MNVMKMTEDEFERKLEEARIRGYNLAQLEHRKGEKNAYDLGYKKGYTEGYNAGAQGKNPDLRFFGKRK